MTMATLGRSRPIIEFTLRLANMLPAWAVSTWYFKCRADAEIRWRQFNNLMNINKDMI